jgi:uncharacterized membrane protein
MANALEPRRERRRMSACSIAGITLGALVLGFVLANVPDIIRYIRISSM